MSSSIIFDIETGPLPESELANLEPKFKPPANYKNAEAIAKWTAEARQEWREQAALSAISGRVLAIGYGYWDLEGQEKVLLSIEDDEAKMLRQFWAFYAGDRIAPDTSAKPNTHWCGYNIFGFDLPFIIRRSWKLRIQVPDRLRPRNYWCDRFVDLMDVWNLGDRRNYAALDQVARHLGVGQKSGDGADFARLLASNPAKACEYLTNDIRLTVGVYNSIFLSF